MTVFDDLETTMGQLVGSAALGGWILGAVIIIALLFPLMIAMFRRGGSAGSGPMFMILIVSGFAVAFNVGVGWWDTWSIVFIGLLIGFGWLISNRGDGGI